MRVRLSGEARTPGAGALALCANAPPAPPARAGRCTGDEAAGDAFAESGVSGITSFSCRALSFINWAVAFLRIGDACAPAGAAAPRLVLRGAILLPNREGATGALNKRVWSLNKPSQYIRRP